MHVSQNREIRKSRREISRSEFWPKIKRVGSILWTVVKPELRVLIHLYCQNFIILATADEIDFIKNFGSVVIYEWCVCLRIDKYVKAARKYLGVNFGLKLHFILYAKM